MNAGLLKSNSTSEVNNLVCRDWFPLGLKMVSFSPTVLLRAVTAILCVLNGILCPFTVAGNALVFMAVLRKTELRTVANTSILCLAFTDLIVGVFVQPSYVVYQASKLLTPERLPCVQLIVYSFSGVICLCFSFLTLILISLERYMAVFSPYRYVAKVNSERVVGLVVTTCVIWVGVILAVRCTFGINSKEETTLISCLIITNFVLTSFVYFRIFKLVRRCNAQVSEISEHSTAVQPAAPTPQMTSNPREAKASKTVACVAGTLFLCFMPTLCATVIDQAQLVRQDLLYHVIYPIAESIVLFNSCLNPAIYVWRSARIRRSLWELLRNCKLTTLVNPLNIT